MSVPRLTLTGIQVEGLGREPAKVSFSSGLNVFSGASDTGKTYIFETIDFLLGAKNPPSSNPASFGYSRAQLGLRVSDQSEATVSRAFDGGEVSLYDESFPISYGKDEPSRYLGPIHRAGEQDTLSNYLLSICGLTGHSLRRNQGGEKVAMTFRHVAHLTLIGEQRIISKSSPATTGQYTTKTLEKSMFSFFLMGTDDGDIISHVKPKEQKARLDAEEKLLEALIMEKEARLRSLTRGQESIGLERTVNAAIEEATQTSTSTRQEIQGIEGDRREKWTALQKVKSRQLYLAEQLKRLHLLSSFYGTDRARLESVLEAGRTFEQLPNGACAICGSQPAAAEGGQVLEGALVEFRAACEQEIRKISELSSDILEVISDCESEERDSLEEEDQLNLDLRRLDDRLRLILKPQSVRTSRELSELISLKSDVARAIDLAAEISQLRDRLDSLRRSKGSSAGKPRIVSRIGTAAAFRFSEMVKETLEAWRFPLRGAVSFDPDQFDIVLGDQNRGSLGKGHRALTHAAFTVGLMRYCRAEGIPHPGLVVLDTPLNPYKGPDKEDGGRVNDEIQEAFYEDLARERDGDQVIVFENTEPPMSLRESIQYQHFSRNSQIGRFGFFPVSQVKD